MKHTNIKILRRSFTFINGTPYLKTTYKIIDPQLLKNSISTKSNKRNIKIVLKDKVKTIVNKNNINPFSAKEQILLSLNLIKSAISSFIRGIKNLDSYFMKNPIILPFYYVVKKILVPIAVMRVIVRKFKIIRIIL